MKIAQLAWLLLTVCSLLVSLPIQGLPVQVPYSGQLAENGDLVNGNKTMRFEILDATAARRYDSGPVSVTLSNGGFRVLLGGTNQPALDSAVFAEPGRRLRVTVGDTVLTPDQEIHYTAYAAHAVGATTAASALEATNAAQLGGIAAQSYARLDQITVQAFLGPLTASTVTASSFIGNGSGLVDLNASQLVTGTVPDARLHSSVARLNQPNSWSAPQTFGGGAAFDGNLSVGAGSVSLAAGTVLRVGGVLEFPTIGISGGGSGSGLNADLLDGVSSEQFARLSAPNVFSSAVTFQGPVRVTQPIEGPTDGPLTVNGALAAGSLIGNGAGLTGLNAGHLATGTVDDARLSTNVARLNSYGGSQITNAFSSAVIFQGPVRLTQPIEGPADGPLVVNGSLAAASLSGNGAALTGLNAVALTSGTVSTARGGTGLDTSAAPPGSLLHTVSPGIWRTLGPGAEGQVLKLSGGLPAWGADNTGAGGTVSSISAGVGISLSPNPITTSGTVSIDSGVVALKNAANTFSGTQTIEGSNPLVMDGTTVDANKTTLAIVEPTAPRTITLPDASGTLSVVAAHTESASATPSVKGRTAVVLSGYTAFTAITDLVDGVDGQIVVLIGGINSGSIFVTVVDDSSGGNFRLSALGGGGDWQVQPNRTLTVVRANGAWFEMARSQN